MNKTLLAISLDDASGIAHDGSRSRVVGVALKSAPAGNITISGVGNLDGSAASWVITAGSTAFSAAPASAFAKALSFSYANPADAGKAVLIFQPL